MLQGVTVQFVSQISLFVKWFGSTITTKKGVENDVICSLFLHAATNIVMGEGGTWI